MGISKCICCGKRAGKLMGKKCGDNICKCRGLYCPHCGGRLAYMGQEGYSRGLAVCRGCSCGYTGKPGNAPAMPDMLCAVATAKTAAIEAGKCVTIKPRRIRKARPASVNSSVNSALAS